MANHRNSYPRGEEIVDDYLELQQAVEEFKHETGVRFPSVYQIIKIAEGMGWERFNYAEIIERQELMAIGD